MSSIFALALLAVPLFAISTPCFEELAQILQRFSSIFPEDEYSTMAVASGKSPNDLGDFSLCAEVKEAKYALFSAYTPGTWIMSSGVAIGLCGPEVCSQSDYDSLLSNNFTQPDVDLFFGHVHAMKTARFHLKNSKPAPSNVQIRVVFPQSFDVSSQVSFRDWLTFLISVLLLCLLVTGTIIDIRGDTGLTVKSNHIQMLEVDEKRAEAGGEPPKESGLRMVLKCFSLYTNVPKLFSLKAHKDREPLDVLHALRVLSMLWIIYGHVCQFRLTVSPLKNFYEIYDKMKEWRYAFVYGAEFSVDSFFYMSGLLMAYLFLSALQTKQTMTAREMLMLYSHRLYRIVPAYAFILFLLWTGLRYLGSGPLWFQQGYLNTPCEDYWWTNLLFVNNLVPAGDGNMCFTQSWYLANDMQFFALSPPLLYAYHRGKKWLGWTVLAGVVAGSIGISLYIADEYGYNVVAIAPENATFYYNYYTKPYCRVAPYAFGIASGMVLNAGKCWKQSGEVYDSLALSVARLMDNQWVRYLCYLSGLFLMNFILFCHYSAYREVDAQWQSWSPLQNILFLGFNHAGFSLGLILFLQPILQGYNSGFHCVFGHPIWAPGARLTFCVYLAHLHLIFAYFLNGKTAYWVDDLNVGIDVVFAVVMAYSAAVALTLVVESPFIALEKCLRQGRKPKDG